VVLILGMLALLLPMMTADDITVVKTWVGLGIGRATSVADSVPKPTVSRL